ncbi:hypothetical protein CIHG_08410 [Coccidioides immitis H538.4]|uniref:RRM domain-containing protein n=1 Tax=Coccidioides immitis H538.4 TaxID=396776 RepID=A0A0J8S152_COCIT|nr:hypothetical protein CIHG_08410 [Coccidioides immitis H538.4]
MPTRRSISRSISPSRSRSPPPRDRSRSVSSGRSRSASPRRSPSPRARSRSRSRSRTPRSRTRSLTPRSRSPSPRRNGRGRGRSLSRTDSRSPYSSRTPSRDRHGGRYRDRSYSRSPSPPRRSTKIVVEKLTKNVNEDHLREIFGAYGDIQSIDLPMNRQFMTNRRDRRIYAITMPLMPSQQIAHMHERPTRRRRPQCLHRSYPPHILRSHFQHGYPRAPNSTTGIPAPSRYRSPPRRRFRAPRGMDRHDLYRPRSVSRSRSRTRSPPPPARSPLYSSRSPTPPPRRRGRRDSYDSPRRRRRGSSYDSLSNRSRSPSRSRYSRR